MSLFFSEKPVICQVHRFCIASGAVIARCSDLLLIEDTATIGVSNVAVWGVPTISLWVQRIGFERAKRLLLTDESITSKQASEWGLAIEAPLRASERHFKDLGREIGVTTREARLSFHLTHF
jgi:enoyl-CoA hydratase